MHAETASSFQTVSGAAIASALPSAAVLLVLSVAVSIIGIVIIRPSARGTLG
ncbi:MAG: hypothetical protein AB7P40_26675 [Chloroflexota bacterium]